MKIYLIRHTKPDIKKGICYGISDLDVADTFQAEAEEVKTQLPPIDRHTLIYSSPLIRCHKLAEYLAGSNPIFKDNRLVEISFGDWEMRRWQSIGKKTLLKWRANFVDIPPPNGESFRSVFERVKEFYDEILQLEVNQVFIIGHSGVIRAFLCNIQGIPLANSFDEQFGYGVVFEIEGGIVNRLK